MTSVPDPSALPDGEELLALFDAAGSQDEETRSSTAAYLAEIGLIPLLDAAQEWALAERVQAQGKGEAEPVAPNDSAANRARNRRVEIELRVAAAGGRPS